MHPAAKIEFHFRSQCFEKLVFPILMMTWWENFQSLWFGPRNWWVIETVLEDGFYRYFALVAKVKGLRREQTNHDLNKEKLK